MNKVYFQEQFIGTIENNKPLLQFCPACRIKNWDSAVSLGQCGWCGFKPINYHIKIESKPQGNRKTN